MATLKTKASAAQPVTKGGRGRTTHRAVSGTVEQPSLITRQHEEYVRLMAQIDAALDDIDQLQGRAAAGRR
jgi:hypothetical protein